jgi:2-(3-amino-3-carboxypropyl)histidine synthase|tara:strand:+ start:683 stop:1669 length:987 start_codon:yes stop_codon:yes gene_type:complete
MALNFELGKLKEELEKRQPKKVLVQLPEGIKQNALEIKKVIEDLDIEVIFSGETAWGGCSIATYEAEALKVDLLVHFGHAEFIKSNFPILYIEVRDELNLLPLLKKSLEKIKEHKTLGLAYSIQHRHDVEKVKKFYEDNGKEILISDKKGYAAYAGHVVGCEFGGLKTIQDKVDAFLVIGNNFHSMGASLAVEKPVILLDVYNNCVTEMEGVRDKIIKQRIIAIEKFKDAKKVGVIMEVKPGQKFGSPKFLVEKLEKAGKEVLTITMNELTPDKLMNFYNLEAFVELGCPRIAIDDFAKYPKTLITFKEALIATGDKNFEDVIKEGLI